MSVRWSEHPLARGLLRAQYPKAGALISKPHPFSDPKVWEWSVWVAGEQIDRGEESSLPKAKAAAKTAALAVN